MKSLIFSVLVGTILLLPMVSVEAAELLVRPFLIDKMVEARELLQEEVTLTNQSSRKQVVYATVNEITVDNDGEIKQFVSPVMTDRTNTITSWVEITRGRIEIEPGETKTVTLGFRIHPNAEPGEYHVFIGFGVASKRFQAESAAMKGEVDGVIAKLTIEDETNEYLRIAGFIIDRFVSSDDDKKVEVELENLGDVNATPVGEIIFFNSKGEELEAIQFNADRVSIPPNESMTIVTEIPFGNELGRFKANLSLQYGLKQKASLYDTTQFFMMPMHILLAMLLAAILIGLFIFFLLYRALSLGREEGYDETHDVPFYVRDGHDAEPKDHDIDLSNKE